MAPKRKVDAKQPSLEETTGQPVTQKRTRKGRLTQPEVSKVESPAGDLAQARLAKKHGNDPVFKKAAKGTAEASTDTSKDDSAKSGFVEINRAPVLTLWVATVAQREGHSHDASLTFGKAIAGLLAQSKGKSIGVFEATEQDEAAKDKKHQREEEAGVENVSVFGMSIKALETKGELRAVEAGSNQAMDAGKVQAYLQRAFKNRLSDVKAVLKELAESFSEDQIGKQAYHLYEQFRPSVAQGKQGWGAKGRLEFDRIRELKAK